MDNFVRCKDCNGAKNTAPLGFIFKDCDTCNGVGYVEGYTQVIHTSEQAVNNVVKVETGKKRGRPIINK